jgi:hypothetical protein
MFWLLLSIGVPAVGLAIGYFVLRGSEAEAFSKSCGCKEPPLKAGVGTDEVS